MKLIADLHIHSRFSQATSKDLVIDNLEKYARIKGVGMLGTGDFTHPKWIQELKTKLKDDSTGIYKTESGFAFMLQTEISLIYSQGGSGRRIHNIVYAPEIEVCDQITEYLLKFGRVDYDGRPIFKIPCPQFVGDLKNIDKRIEVVPAHIWTPWFSLFGSKSGFDTVKECFQEQTKHIFAMETGLSSDPAMNWRLSQLDGYTMISNSDLHSFWPWRIGREANEFELKNEDELTYDKIIDIMKTRKGFTRTIEVDPNYGKYHYDGHRKCNVCFSPQETMKYDGICPVCKSPLTIGVEYRVEELADREMGYRPKDAVDFISPIPLSEILSLLTGKALATKTVWAEYNKLVDIKNNVNEFDVLLDKPYDWLIGRTSEKIAKAIIMNRNGEIKVSPGYDGEYGVPQLDGVPEKKTSKNKNLSEGNDDAVEIKKKDKEVIRKLVSTNITKEDKQYVLAKKSTGSPQRGLDEFW